MRAITLKILKFTLLLTLFVQTASGEVVLKVERGGWGSSDLQDIKAVCRSVVESFPPPREDFSIRIAHNEQGPMVLYRRAEDGSHIVWLKTKDRRWAQLAFQFGHEYGHILSRYNRKKNPQGWLEESIAETASLYALLKMAETWQTTPPYSNWKSYAPHLKSYALDRINDVKPLRQKYPDLIKWYKLEKKSLEKDLAQRTKNTFVATWLLPIFQENPEMWNCLYFLNQEPDFPSYDGSLKDYLKCWYRYAPKNQKKIVLKIAKLFGVL